MLERIGLYIFSFFMAVCVVLDVVVATGVVSADLYGVCFIGMFNVLTVIGYSLILFMMRIDRMYGEN